MNGHSNAQHPDARNLTGVWNGLYTYATGLSVSFVATLIDGGGSGLFGATHEPDIVGGKPGHLLLAQLSGSRHASAIAFIKTYETADDGYFPVDYDGTLNGDATEIEGRWRIGNQMSGKFLMIRAGGKTAAIENKKHARV